MAESDNTSPADVPSGVIDLTVVAPLSSVELRAEVDRMVAEVIAATRRVAPLLKDATALLAQVDRMVIDYACSGGDGAVDERYWAASRSTGHDQLFDALQALSVLSDAYVVTNDRHPVAVSVPAG